MKFVNILKTSPLFLIIPLLLCPVGLYALSGNYRKPAVKAIVVFPGKENYKTPTGLDLYLIYIYIRFNN